MSAAADIDPAMPISADLAATAAWLRGCAADGVPIDGVAAVFIAEALDEAAMRVRELEQAQRGRHVDAVAKTLAQAADGRAQVAGREAAIGAGVASGVVLDYRAVFAREMRDSGRPVPPHLLALADAQNDDGDAA